jgi:hypothetical protein
VHEGVEVGWPNPEVSFANFCVGQFRLEAPAGEGPNHSKPELHQILTRDSGANQAWSFSVTSKAS